MVRRGAILARKREWVVLQSDKAVTKKGESWGQTFVRRTNGIYI
jgi:hypothetical protein